MTTITEHEPMLALLQRHQAQQIGPQHVHAARRRLASALSAAECGRRPDPELLVRQLATDLGITLELPR